MSSVRPCWSAAAVLAVSYKLLQIWKSWLNFDWINRPLWLLSRTVAGRAVVAGKMAPLLSPDDDGDVGETETRSLTGNLLMRCWIISVLVELFSSLSWLSHQLWLEVMDILQSSPSPPSHYHHQASYQELEPHFFLKSISKNYFNEDITIDLCTLGLLHSWILTTMVWWHIKSREKEFDENCYELINVPGPNTIWKRLRDKM